MEGQRRSLAVRVGTGLLGMFLIYAAGCTELRIATGYRAFDVAEVEARAETEPVRNPDDAADDAAIWVDAHDSSRSTVIGTDKTEDGELTVYDLDGAVLHRYADGSPNNVDVRQGVPMGDQELDLVVTSDRATNTIRVYSVDPETRGLVDLAELRLRVRFAPYGLCLHVDEADRVYAFVTSDEDGIIEQWSLEAAGSGRVDGQLVRTIETASKVEGCVVDDGDGTLYLTEEDVGLWAYDARPEAPSTGTLLAEVLPAEGGELVADVEGVAIHESGRGQRHLLVSSQGSSDFAVYQLDPFGYVGRFRIVDGVVDGVDGTDGIAVTGVPLGLEYPEGLFVAQDDDNADGNQNFKFVAWDDIASVLDLPA
jgi:3-phytase